MEWYERPMRVLRRDYISQFEQVMALDLHDEARACKEDWHANVEWVMATPGAEGRAYQTTFNTPLFEKLPALGEFDVLRAYIPHAVQHGIQVIAYVNMHWYAVEFAARHPEWEQVLADGTPYGERYPLYGNGRTLCVNSAWRDWALEMIREVTRTGVAGLFLDGPVVYPGCCYCPACRVLFLERFHAPLPAQEDWCDPLWKQFIDFREESMAGFLRDAHQAVRSVNPQGIVYCNAGSWHARGWRVARDILRLQDHQEINGAEAFFHPGPVDHALHASGMTAKYLRAGRRPAMVFTHHAYGAYHYVPLNEQEMTLAIAQTAAGGASPWFAVFAPALEHSRAEALRGAAPLYGFLERNERYYVGARSWAEVAVLVSSQTAHYYCSALEGLYYDLGSGREQDLIADAGAGQVRTNWPARKERSDQLAGGGYPGVYLALVREHLCCDVVLDEGLTLDTLKRYAALILPNAACLSDAQIDALCRYVAQGGGLVATFESGRYDERGNLRACSPLWELFGVQYLDGLFPPSVGEQYLRVTDGSHPLTAGFGMGQLLPRPVYALQVRPMPDASTPIGVMNPLPSVYTPLRGLSPYAGAIARSEGQGRVVYVPSLLATAYWTQKTPSHQRLLANAVRWAMGRPCALETDAPPTVQVELWAQGAGQGEGGQAAPSRILIHLVNSTGDMQRPLTCLYPVCDLHIALRCPKPTEIRQLSDGQSLPFEHESGRVRFSVPRLESYEVASLELTSPDSPMG